VDCSDEDDDEEHEADESEVQPSRKRKRGEGAHGKYISYHKASNKYCVQVRKDGEQQYVGSFPTQEEAVVARDAYKRGETDI
jgi:hypothetical protein